MAKDAIAVIVFEESILCEILEEDPEFEKTTLAEVVTYKNRPSIYLSIRPIIYPENNHYSAQTCIELYSPPPEV